MTNGICPKCSSRHVYYSDASGIQHGISIDRSSPLVNIYKENKWVPDIMMLEMAYYLCQTCGYFEAYVKDVGGLSKLEDSTNWRRVQTDELSGPG